MGNIYSWKTYNREVPAQDVGERIEELAERDGQVTKQSLLEDARPAGATLHPLYEWDDAKAAEKYRLSQSGEILNNLTIVHVEVTEQEEPKPVRAFVNVSSGKITGAYKPISVAFSQPDEAEIVIANAKRDLLAMQERLERYIDFRRFLMEFLRETE